MKIIESKLHHVFGPTPAKRPVAFSRKPSGLLGQAIDQLVNRNPELELEFDRTGHVRHLVATKQTLFSGATFTGDARAHAAAFLATAPVFKALDLEGIELDEGESEALPYGHRVDYKQFITLKCGRKLRVRNGSIGVHMNSKGDVFSVNSTLKVFPARKVLGKVISEEAAKEAAKKHMESLIAKIGKDAKQFARELTGGLQTCSAKAELVLSEHEGRFDPVYEVELSICEPRQLMQMLVKARTGEVVYHESKLHFSIANQRTQVGLNRIAAKTLLRIPDPKVSVAKQVVDHYVEDLPDATTLKNHRMVMLVRKNRKWVEVKAKADGTYNFDSVKEKDEFAAVVTFIALNTQLVWMEKLGMKTKYEPLKVYMNDPSVRDNAYLDPENWEVHIGIGSGIGAGLVQDIFLDLGVSWHENGHGIVTIQAPGKDLPGNEGGAIHEATGDVLGQILVSYLFRLKFGGLINYPVSRSDIKVDPRIIGAYALPPDGIRKQRNGKTVRDKTGEVHDDGEIVGGALADLLEAMATGADVTDDGAKLEAALENYARIYLMALALVPASRVTFRDLRRALITADQQLLNGANRSAIESNFDKRGITSGQGNTAGATGGRRRRR
ncbi:MAG TPA: M36 family metallopeptidase [Candidatus Obscuribacter sp.]|nr:M36 family metallopeptidase [Candidatus Obscuribacter sp.]